MRNRKDSVGAKAAAWVGITLGAVVFFAGSAGVLLMDQAGVYEMSREQFLTKSYQSVADQYAIRALDYSVNMENGAKPEKIGGMTRISAMESLKRKILIP